MLTQGAGEGYVLMCALYINYCDTVDGTNGVSEGNDVDMETGVQANGMSLHYIVYECKLFLLIIR